MLTDAVARMIEIFRMVSPLPAFAFSGLSGCWVHLSTAAIKLDHAMEALSLGRNRRDGMKFVRRIAALLAAALGTYVVAVVANSQFVMNAHNVPISFSDRFNMTAFDVSNMWLYLVIILVALLLGFLIAALVKRLLPRLSRYAFPVAGAAAIGATLGLMYIVFQTVPISGARSAMGFLSQVIAGGIGGWIFARMAGGAANSGTKPSENAKTVS
ncbi:hypothetical protein [Pontixanthobacter aquaemixtae]|uniref:Uncharacterized protein n=1 Tax=Pontixanthobacter aquaemixtae TaxID=1958940 RepID=A0A844ZYZ2_9SPHN|nr:hypothetical protein [Pontixanthobacter aquaemixtae]MXO91957.1 hypothetical protein [Pontixanthobacter aquaemixtae]